MARVTAVGRGPLVAVDGCRGSVHLALARTVYVQVAAGAPMLVVHGPDLAPTPTSVVVPAPLGGTIAPGDPVAGRAGYLRLGAVTVDLRHAPAWRPRPAGAGHQEVPLAARAIARGGGTPALAGDTEALASAVLAGDRAQLDAAARRLVGRGPGLTPAGDDAVLGLAVLLHRSGGAALVDRLAAAVRPLLPSTTPVSAHYLRLGLAGWAGEVLLDAVDAALGRPGLDPVVALARLAGTGATSGADTLAGLAAGLDLLDRLRRKDAA